MSLVSFSELHVSLYVVGRQQKGLKPRASAISIPMSMTSFGVDDRLCF